MAEKMAIKIRLETTAQNLHAAIDRMWQEPVCPECEGSLSEDRTTCWTCRAADYIEEGI